MILTRYYELQAQNITHKDSVKILMSEFSLSEVSIVHKVMPAPLRIVKCRHCPTKITTPKNVKVRCCPKCNEGLVKRSTEKRQRKRRLIGATVEKFATFPDFYHPVPFWIRAYCTSVSGRCGE